MFFSHLLFFSKKTNVTQKERKKRRKKNLQLPIKHFVAVKDMSGLNHGIRSRFLVDARNIA